MSINRIQKSEISQVRHPLCGWHVPKSVILRFKSVFGMAMRKFCSVCRVLNLNFLCTIFKALNSYFICDPVKNLYVYYIKIYVRNALNRGTLAIMSTRVGYQARPVQIVFDPQIRCILN